MRMWLDAGSWPLKLPDFFKSNTCNRGNKEKEETACLACVREWRYKNGLMACW